jgi:serpin B
MDFMNKPEECRIAINQWVSDQTEGRIEDLIPQGAIDELTRLVLTNAIYFNAAWEHQFDEDDTLDRPFYLLDGSQVKAPMMRLTTSFNYTDGNGYQAIELPYDGGELSMVIIMPDEGNFEAFESSLDSELVENIIRDMEDQRVRLMMPKFEFASELSLTQALAAMGMPAAFSNADFSGMTGTYELFISDVIHQAFVSVDEYGTEAAAATAVIMAGATPPSNEPVTLDIDHPFIFLIRDMKTGSVLFVGRVLNPNA